MCPLGTQKSEGRDVPGRGPACAKVQRIGVEKWICSEWLDRAGKVMVGGPVVQAFGLYPTDWGVCGTWENSVRCFS